MLARCSKHVPLQLKWQDQPWLMDAFVEQVTVGINLRCHFCGGLQRASVQSSDAVTLPYSGFGTLVICAWILLFLKPKVMEYKASHIRCNLHFFHELFLNSLIEPPKPTIDLCTVSNCVCTVCVMPGSNPELNWLVMLCCCLPAYIS